ncbi:MAG: peptide chain release factor N(5)-glutamine methyltransferase [Lachnospiraceae bacterium]|nr:peptide chain release factor N(5)-glutamine methyltransferase [Lachnospiraceae bacterium]
MTYREVYAEGVARLTAADIDEAALDARLLLEYVCGTDRNTLLVHGDREVSGEEDERYQLLIEKRGQHIPLQHLTGEQDFMGLTFKVNEHVLIPRQDTEILVEEVMKNLHDGMCVLDMCTGSGCILLSLLQYSNDCVGVGVDLSAEALAVARENYAGLKENKPEMDAVFLQGNLFEALEALNGADRNRETVGDLDIRDHSEKVPKKFDIIVSNPPYIRTGVIDTLMPEVREHEPLMALDGMADGLYFYREITKRAKTYLNPGGMLYYEIGYDQAADVTEILAQEGFRGMEVVQDFAGLDRVVCGMYY